MPEPFRSCLARGCKRSVMRVQFMCIPHWAVVDPEDRKVIERLGNQEVNGKGPPPQLEAALERARDAVEAWELAKVERHDEVLRSLKPRYSPQLNLFRGRT